MKTSRRRARRGFTLIEVLLVLVILGVLAALVVPNLIGTQQQANVDAARASIKGLEQALKYHAHDHGGEYLQGNRDSLLTLLEDSEYNGKKLKPYIEDSPKDAWGELLYYEFPNTKSTKANKPAIWSSGANRQNEDGAGDDITNWTTN